MITVFVMQTCPDCAAIKAQAEGDPRFQLIDIGQQPGSLKRFLAMRDNEPAFAPVRKRGTIGIPCFLLEDGSITFSSEKAYQSLGENADAIRNSVPEVTEAEENASCSLDGKGC